MLTTDKMNTLYKNRSIPAVFHTKQPEDLISVAIDSVSGWRIPGTWIWDHTIGSSGEGDDKNTSEQNAQKIFLLKI